jgi:hypothetical protein
MVELPASPCMERRNEGYHMSGRRISLDSVAYGVIRGESVDEIHEAIPGYSVFDSSVSRRGRGVSRIRIVYLPLRRLWDDPPRLQLPHQLIA